MTLAYYHWRFWDTSIETNGLLVILILAASIAILIYTIDFIARKIRKKNS